jgi:hypothetical protein
MHGIVAAGTFRPSTFCHFHLWCPMFLEAWTFWCFHLKRNANKTPVCAARTWCAPGNTVRTSYLANVDPNQTLTSRLHYRLCSDYPGSPDFRSTALRYCRRGGGLSLTAVETQVESLLRGGAHRNSTLCVFNQFRLSHPKNDRGFDLLMEYASSEGFWRKCKYAHAADVVWNVYSPRSYFWALRVLYGPQFSVMPDKKYLSLP